MLAAAANTLDPGREWPLLLAWECDWVYLLQPLLQLSARPLFHLLRGGFLCNGSGIVFWVTQDEMHVWGATDIVSMVADNNLVWFSGY